MSCFLPWRHILFIITTDEKRWPWHSSDVTKEGMLTSAEVLPDINRFFIKIELQHALCFITMSCFFFWPHGLFMITTDDKRWPWHSSDVTKEGMLVSTDCYLTQIVFNSRRMNSNMPCVLLIPFLSLAPCFVYDHNRWETLAMAVVRRYQGRYAYLN